MSDFEEIQRIIRLKRHEQPPPGFVEDFVGKLQNRQRTEWLNQSARGLVWERLGTVFGGFFAPKWGLAGATAMALVAAFFAFKPAAQSNSAPLAGAQPPSHGFEVTTVGMAEGVEPISQEEVERYLTIERLRMARHYRGGLADEHATQPQYALPPLPSQSGLLPAGLQMDVDLK